MQKQEAVSNATTLVIPQFHWESRSAYKPSMARFTPYLLERSRE
jgi:hypothetical protein